MANDPYTHHIELRVRWAEVDAQGVVFNGHYLTYCDVAVTEYWRAIGVRYPQDFLDAGSDIFVRKATVDFLAPACFDDLLSIGCRTVRLGRSSLLLGLAVHRLGPQGPEAAVATAELVYVNADPHARHATPWTEALRGCIRRYERTPPEEETGA